MIFKTLWDSSKRGGGSMRYLSLFTGVGGGDLAFQHMLNWQCAGYVEWDKYCQRVLAQRIEDGLFDRAPIFGDVREFVQSGAAAEYRGVADVVTGGFPCQPFSVAGKRRGADDERNMWPATIDAIRIIRPRYAFLENVPGLLRSGYFGRILGDLAESGYDARWRILSAAEVGAPHKRNRLWIVAHANGGRRHQRNTGERAVPVTDPQDIRPTWWEAEPGVGRVADGVADRTHRLKAIGNGIVPAVAAQAWRLLTELE